MDLTAACLRGPSPRPRGKPRCMVITSSWSACSKDAQIQPTAPSMNHSWETSARYRTVSALLVSYLPLAAAYKLRLLEKLWTDITPGTTSCQTMAISLLSQMSTSRSSPPCSFGITLVRFLGVHLIHGHSEMPENTMLPGKNFEEAKGRWAKVTQVEAVRRLRQLIPGHCPRTHLCPRATTRSSTLANRHP
ncbi:hypothetical protein B0T17DRAFT_137088 [Bombardia bombarda]|uniref:Uncharacterized protein n=1 Tax=Bombardia bombarda TaxID=252184 RepID=A0AA39W3Q6_9PEZI|nr:hypothetical protein B0T17DRAFT_137088 [Bombardia bombarda]